MPCRSICSSPFLTRSAQSVRFFSLVACENHVAVLFVAYDRHERVAIAFQPGLADAAQLQKGSKVSGPVAEHLPCTRRIDESFPKILKTKKVTKKVKEELSFN
jgi:hypothetical protein